MYTSILLFALSAAPAADLSTPTWSTDYYAANNQSAKAMKPMAVVLGSGEAGYEKLARDGKLTDEAKGLLATKYVCVYVDTETQEGKRLAKAFNMPNGQGLVISDRTGDVQAFRHEGELGNADLVRNLERFADVERPVVRTETTATQRSSFYEPATAAPAYARPAFYPSFSPGYFPSCRGGR
jgi:hypothetical protein